MNAIDLTTNYLGISLKNPFIVSSSGLTSTFEKVKQCEEAGASAVVLKSIFEEQMAAEGASLESYSDYPEAADYLRGYVEQNALSQYTELIAKCAKECSIPVIASINCSQVGSWTKYARDFENAGAAAIELNIFTLPSKATTTSAEVEAHYMEIVEKVQKEISIPLSVKIPENFSAPINIVQQLYYRGVKGVTMFNRFYAPDVDLRKVTLNASSPLSTPEEIHTLLRWVALASAEVPIIDIAASTGIHNAEGALKAVLCGATVVEFCSTLYKNGLDYLPTIIKEFKEWAENENYSSISDMRAKLNSKHEKNAEIHERAQFMRYFSSYNG